VDDHLLPAWQVGVALRVPLFDRGTDAARAEAEARTRQLSARVRQLDELRAATARATAAAASTAEERAALAAELVAHAERAAARAEADAGRRGDPADPLIRAHSDLRRARLEQTLAAIDLAAATFRAAH
ncbi:MAG TPA: TolC family protein, partial [Kofleriaceae bacterium]|nr:TolC family protein [Kofleriaceae bacterium]